MFSFKVHLMILMGVSLSSGYMDLSTNKPTSQSLTRPCSVAACKNFYISSNAVDRDERTCTGSRVFGGSNAAENSVWWRVDLGDIYSIYSISILFENYYGYGSTKNLYGENCENKCPINCEDQRCNIINGTCFRCTGGWTGQYCEYKCPRGLYGLDCKQACSGSCRNNDVCNHVTGRCDNGCADGWKRINCNESCKDGKYGPGCIYNCSGHCLNDVHCNKKTGHCDTGCKPGYTGNLCNTDELSREKTTKQSPTRGCVYSCGAGLAVDGDISSCMETQGIGGSSPEDSMWWHVDLGDTYSISSISIVFKSYGDQYVERDRGRIAGFSIFLSNSTSKEDGWRCYKDGPELPPLNFSTDCIGHARYVIYYNERINGETYPEKYQAYSYNYLCEVIVKGCQKGVYGSDCNTSCPENCQHQRCNIVNGSCLDCKPGWTGHTCERSTHM